MNFYIVFQYRKEYKVFELFTEFHDLKVKDIVWVLLLDWCDGYVFPS